MNDKNKKTDFCLDLRSARRKSGLTQADCAHLMSCDATKLTRLEGGNTLPSMADLCMLSLIFGRTFESLYAYLLKECRESLALTLENLPDCPGNWMGRRNRQATLERIAADLADYLHGEHGRA